MNDCIRNKAGILIGLFTLLGCFAVRAQDIAVKTNLLYGGLSQTPNIGAEATGVAGMAADIGDIITTGMVVLAGAGAEVEAVVGQVLPIQTVVLPDKAVTGILLLFVVMVRVPFVPVVLLFGEALQFVQKVVLFVLLVLLIVGELLPDV